MKISKLMAFAVGLISLLGFASLFCDVSNTPVTLWFKEAFIGLAFSFAFGAGLANWAAYVLTALIFLVVFLIGYHLSRSLFDKIDQKLASR